MNISEERRAYLSLIRNKLPFSGGTKLLLENKFSLSKIFMSMSLCEVVMDYSYLPQNVRDEAKRIYLTLSNLLIALPTGNEVFVATCNRQLSEELLRIAYFKLIDPAFNPKSYLSFRNLWDEGLKHQLSASTQLMTTWCQLASMFKENSILLHNISSSKKSTIEYLDNLISFSSMQSIPTVNSYIRTAYNYLINYIPSLLKLKPELMTLSQKAEYKKFIH